MLIADTGTEVSSFKYGMGKDYLRIFDAVSLQCGIEILNSQFLCIRLLIIIYRSVVAGELSKPFVEGLHLLVQRMNEWQGIDTCPAVGRQPLKL